MASSSVAVTVLLFIVLILEGSSGGGSPLETSEGEVSAPTSDPARRGARHYLRRRSGEGVLLGDYYTMHQDQAHVTLKIRVDGDIVWDHGIPTLFSVFREQVITDKSSGERMYTLEAPATRHLICVNARGRLYTVSQVHRRQRRKGKEQNKIRHLEHKRRRSRRHTWRGLATRRQVGHYRSPFAQPPHLGSRLGPHSQRRGGGRVASPPPPRDCLLRTFEFSADESYERSVGIYSVPHSNTTHGRFLSRNETNGEPRTFRKAFRNLYLHPLIKVSQVPIRYLAEMISVTRFGREEEWNSRVRACLTHLLVTPCTNHRDKVRRHAGHFYRLIERCKARARRTPKPPSCFPASSSSNHSASRQPHHHQHHHRQGRLS